MTGRLGRLGRGVRGLDDRPLNGPSLAIPVDPFGDRALSCTGAGRAFERGHRFGVPNAVARRHDAVVPLHRLVSADALKFELPTNAVPPSCSGEDVGLGVKRARNLQAIRSVRSGRHLFRTPAARHCLRGREPHQRVRLRDAQIVAGQQSEVGRPVQQIAEVLEDAVHAAFEREADDDIGAVGRARCEMMCGSSGSSPASDQVRVALASDVA